MKKIYIFNAPPRAGKDFTVDYLKSNADYPDRIEIATFKEPVIEATCKVLGISESVFMDGYDMPVWKYYETHKYVPKHTVMTNWWKDALLYEINGKMYSKRTALIYVSEQIFKPMFGNYIWGRLVADTIQESNADIILIPDGGFKEEIEELCDRFGVGVVKLIQIEKDGCTFIGDSRDYVSLDGVPFNSLYNSGDENYCDELKPILSEINTLCYTTGSEDIPF